jgi:prephenate dehydrogenase
LRWPQGGRQVEEVVGFGRSLATLTQALDLGIIDRVGANAGQEVADADLVLIATPVGQMPEIMARIAPYLGPDTVVTDGGSTKSDVVAVARAYFGEQGRAVCPGASDRRRREQRCGGGARRSVSAKRRWC